MRFNVQYFFSYHLVYLYVWYEYAVNSNTVWQLQFKVILLCVPVFRTKLHLIKVDKLRYLIPILHCKNIIFVVNKTYQIILSYGSDAKAKSIGLQLKWT